MCELVAAITTMHRSTPEGERADEHTDQGKTRTTTRLAPLTRLPLAAAIYLAMRLGRVRRRMRRRRAAQTEQGRGAATPGHGHGHRAEARGEPAGRADQHPGAGRPSSSSELNVTDFDDYAKFLPSVSVPEPGRRRGFAPGLHARRGQRRRRQPLRLAAQRRHLSRRAADHHHPGRARHPRLRHRARRGAGRPAGHAVRRQLAGRHDPHHHQQARPQRLLGRLRPRGQHGRRRRHRLRRRGLRQPADQRQRRDPPGRPGTSTTPATSTTSSARAPIPTSGITINNADRAEDDYNDVDTTGARAALRIDLNDNWTITPDGDGAAPGDRRQLRPTTRRSATSSSRTSTRRPPDDRWTQAALTVEGKIGNFDLVYAFAHLKRDVDTESDYTDYALLVRHPVRLRRVLLPTTTAT